MRPTVITCILFLLTNTAIHAQQSVQFTVDTEVNRRAISPYIYGANGQYFDGVTSWRIGGNRMSLYNWENNASHAGEDWFHFNDSYLTYIIEPMPADHEVPGLVYTDFQDRALEEGVFSLVTLQMMGYVSRDKNGNSVEESESAPNLTRWVPVQNRKPGAPESYTLTPDVNDDVVYTDEFLNLLLDRYGPASAETGIDAYSLDNEPGLWTSTHPLARDASWMDPQTGNQVDNPWWHPTGAQELVDKSVDMASTIKEMDPSALVFGPALWGYTAFVNLQGARDWSVGNPSFASQYDYFIEMYLDKMNEASEVEGRRLVDVLDIHWYPQMEGVYGGATDEAASVRRMQAPRSLWDPSYQEASWIIDVTRGPIALIPRVREMIETYDPGIKLSISEYNYGATTHISGGIAQADALGIFGREGLFFASKWAEVDGFTRSAFELYTSYDGAGSSFGDLSVKADTEDHEATSIYAALNSDGDRLHVIVLNKHVQNEVQATVAINGPSIYREAEHWYLDQNSTAIQQGTSLTGADNTFSLTLQPMSAHHFILRGETATSIVERDGVYGFQVSQNYPNPFTTRSEVQVSLPHTQDVTLRVYDVLGRERALVHAGVLVAGEHRLQIDASELPAGVYFYRLTAGNQSVTRRLTVSR